MIRYNTINHPEVFSVTVGNTDIISGVNSTNNSLRLLLTTSKGELLGDPYYGSNIYELIYEPNDDILSDLLVDDILECINLYITDIIVSSNDINISIYSNTVNILINYTYKNSDITGSFELAIRRLDTES